MSKRRTVLLIALTVLVGGATMGRNQQRLSAEAQRVVDYLLKDWETRMHSTSIALGMSNLGMAASDDIRMEVGEHFRANTGLANNLQFWGSNNYILSSEEKRIAKQVINTFDLEGSLPSPDRLSADLSIPADRLKQHMAFMTRAGLLTSESAAPGYGLTEKYASWGGPLRYNFHTITIGDQKPFDVW